MEPIYTPEGAASYLKIEPRTVREYLRDKKILGFKVGKEWRILERDLEAFVMSLREEALAGRTGQEKCDRQQEEPDQE